MEESIREFLEQFAAEELALRCILIPDEIYTFLLKRPSVEPLLMLMNERRIRRLYHCQNWRLKWALEAHGDYYNSRARYEELRRGNLHALDNPGLIFQRQNRHINPFYRHIRPAWVFGRMIHPPEDDDEQMGDFGL